MLNISNILINFFVKLKLKLYKLRKFKKFLEFFKINNFYKILKIENFLKKKLFFREIKPYVKLIITFKILTRLRKFLYRIKAYTFKII